jgi:hypothetical protein
VQPNEVASDSGREIRSAYLFESLRGLAKNPLDLDCHFRVNTPLTALPTHASGNIADHSVPTSPVWIKDGHALLNDVADADGASVGISLEPSSEGTPFQPSLSPILPRVRSSRQPGGLGS